MCSPAFADPCEAPLPNRAGAQFGGIVRYIGDGDSLCVGASANVNAWIEVRLADFDAPELHDDGGQAAKNLLSRIAQGQQAQCVARRGRNGRVRSYDRVIAVCSLGGRRMGDLLRGAGGVEGEIDREASAISLALI